MDVESARAVDLHGMRTLVTDLERRSLDHVGGAPHVLGLRPPAETPCVGQLERKPEILAAGAAEGERLVEAALSAEGRFAAGGV